jgi:hypothetical protein
MLSQRKDYEKHEQGSDRLIPLIDVKKMLALSWPMVAALVRNGTLPTYDVTNRTIDRSRVTEHTRGLRVWESDLKEYIGSIKVK